MSTHDGLVLLAIYVGTIGAGALIEYVEQRVKRAIHRRKRSWKTSLFFYKKPLTFFPACGIIITERGRTPPKPERLTQWLLSRLFSTAFSLSSPCPMSSARIGRISTPTPTRVWSSTSTPVWTARSSRCWIKGWKALNFFIKNPWQIQKQML